MGYKIFFCVQQFPSPFGELTDLCQPLLAGLTLSLFLFWPPPSKEQLTYTTLCFN